MSGVLGRVEQRLQLILREREPSILGISRLALNLDAVCRVHVDIALADTPPEERLQSRQVLFASSVSQLVRVAACRDHCLEGEVALPCLLLNICGHSIEQVTKLSYLILRDLGDRH